MIVIQFDPTKHETLVNIDRLIKMSPGCAKLYALKNKIPYFLTRRTGRRDAHAVSLSDAVILQDIARKEYVPRGPKTKPAAFLPKMVSINKNASSRDPKDMSDQQKRDELAVHVRRLKILIKSMGVDQIVIEPDKETEIAWMKLVIEKIA
jgi:hypothetical protein